MIYQEILRLSNKIYSKITILFYNLQYSVNNI